MSAPRGWAPGWGAVRPGGVTGSARAALWLRRGAAGLALLLAAGAGAIELTPQEAAGRRLYREGLTSSGEPVAARVGVQSVVLSGAAVRCANCHGPDGQGRPEGGLRPPDITWRELAKPYGHRHDNGREHPPFDLAGLGRVLAEGRDPAGHHLDPAMPRYALSGREVAALAAYLRRIDEDRDPGLAADRLRIGALLPGSGPLADSGRLAQQVLQGVFDQVNAGGGLHGRRLELVVVDAAAADWPARLAEAEVFALAAPLVPGRGDELQALADRIALPVVGPLAADGADDAGHVFQLGAGEREQARVLAEFAVRHLGLDRPAVALVAGTPDRGAADAVIEQLARHGWRQVLRPPPEQALAATVADGQRQGVAAVFFLGPRESFAALRQAAAAAGWQPAFLAPAARVSAQEVAAGGGTLYLALPALPSDGSPAGRQAFAELRRRQDLPPRQPALQVAAYAAATVLVEGLKRSGRAASRARLVQALENLHAFDTGVTPPVGFGPGRRVGVAGAHVLQHDPATGGLRPVGRFLRLE